MMIASDSYDLLGNQQYILCGDKQILTLRDIMPENGPMKMLIIAKTSAPTSVSKGHYFQGQQGKMFWNMLKKYNLLRIPPNQFEDDFLLSHGYGITDIVKVPHNYGDEPTSAEYRLGIERSLVTIKRLQPEVVMFKSSQN